MKIKIACLVAFIVFMIPYQARAAKATAVIQGTQENSELAGSVHLEDTDEGLLIEAEVFGAPPGLHGFHIHENGSCEDQGNAAGGHYNPDSAPHGFLPADGLEHAHAGDLGNIEINEEGEGTLGIMLPNLTLSGGKYNVGGRAVILHEKLDDFGQPVGNAGARIGCGVIQTEE